MSILEQLVLNGLALNTEAGNFVLEAVTLPPPAKKPEWAQGADSDGAELIRTPLYENRTITATVRVVATTMNQALEKVGELADLLQEAEKNPQGSPLVWTPANSTKSITFYVLTGRVVDVPIAMQGDDVGWFVAMPKIPIEMTCKPFGYGAEVEAAAAKSIETGLSVVVLTVPTLAGDIPAEGRLVITDTAAVGRRYVEWGLENRYYNASTSLIEAAEAMTPVGGVRSEAANTGAYSPSSTKKTIATTLVNEPTICLNTGVLKHVGSFRVKARVQVVLGAESLAEKVKLRLSYQDGEGPLRANAWQTPNLGGKYVEVDLGVITTTTAISGTQKWLGQIEAYSENSAGKDILHANYLTFVPVGEGLYGKARGAQSTAPGTITAFDNFPSGSGALNTRTPVVGTAWATSGAATDWTVAVGEVLRKTTTDSEPRLGVLGSAIGNSAITAAAKTKLAEGGEFTLGVILRWVNSTNYAFLLMAATNPITEGPVVKIKLGVVVAGVETVLATAEQSAGSPIGELSLSLSATLDGALTATGHLYFPFTLSGSHSSIATGGALASGKGGIYDRGKAGATERRVTSINIASLAATPYCIQPSQSMEARSDSTITEDSTGTYTGPVPQYRGSRFYVPQDGSANRTSRIVVKADRNDLEESDQQTIGDTFTAQVFATPRYGVIPR